MPRPVGDSRLRALIDRNPQIIDSRQVLDFRSQHGPNPDGSIAQRKCSRARSCVKPRVGTSRRYSVNVIIEG